MDTNSKNSKSQGKGNCIVSENKSLFSFFKAPISNTKPYKNVDLQQVYNKIVGNYYKDRTFELRAISDVKEAKKFKTTNFDYCTFSGIFNTRNDKSLIKHSGLLCVDIDHLQNTDILRNKLLQDKYFDTQLLFVSPSGNGLKWVIPIDTTTVTHSDYFAAVANYILQTYGVAIDKSGNDISRACFLPHDPQAFIKSSNAEVITSKKTFNPSDWANPKITEIQEYEMAIWQNGNLAKSDIEAVTTRIEAAAVDIAPNYENWLKLGFALVDALGESGRTYYHRLSCFYPEYDHTETDEQFDKCLKSKGHGITIKTFYRLAKEAGIDIAKCPNVQNANSTKTTHETQETEILPTLPEKIYSVLPDYLRQITEYANSPEDADILLLGSLVVTSACMQNVFGMYMSVTLFPNLFLFVSAQASAGKGRLSLCRRLVEPVHRQIRDLNDLEFDEYKRQKAECAANRKNTELPQEPPLRLLFIPANSTATAVFQILNDNNGVGLMFETEGDTLAQTFRTEHGNYSDGFRKAFHHETISYLRRKDKEYVSIDVPKLSALLSGTPRQIWSLIPDAENGLFSRFMFYHMNFRLQWIDVFAYNQAESLDQRFNRFGDVFFEFYKTLKKHENIQFSLSDSQQPMLNKFFEQVQEQYFELLGKDFVGTVRRLSVITFRITMVLTVLRMMDTGKINSKIVCSDTDFQIAVEIVKVLLQHAAFVFQQLPQPPTTKHNSNSKTMLFQALPPQFDKAKYIEITKQLGMPESTANKQIKKFLDAGLLTRLKHGNYTKTDNMSMII